MSKIKSAEEWNTLHTIVPKDVSSEDFWMIYDLAESYANYVLKSKLESITDEVKKIQENLILIIEGFEDAKENYGYDLANETYYTEQIIQSTKAIKYRLKTIKDD